MAQIINLRTCFYTRKKYPPNQMVRFIIKQDEIDFNSSTGRGYYLKLDKDINLNNVAKKITNYFHLKSFESTLAVLEQLIKVN